MPRRSPRPALRGAAGPAPVLPGFITRDPHTASVLAEVLVFARSELSVLIEGPSGSGKEIVARGLHIASGRDAWVPVNCGALPESLQEAELFGVKRGAYTGATVDRRGLIEAAAGGTLFLDEVGEMAAAMQAKLLRFLELGEVRRLGETGIRTVSVRVVAATHRDLAAEVVAGRFRGDLYYRLCGARVAIPGLDARPDDVEVIARHFLRELRARGVDPQVEPCFFAGLMQRRWPGQVRELRQVLERASLLAIAAGRSLTQSDVPQPVMPERAVPAGARDDGAGTRMDYPDRVAAFERRLILDALRRAGWNKSRAAAHLGGLKRTTLLGKMQRLGIPDRPGSGAEGEKMG